MKFAFASFIILLLVGFVATPLCYGQSPSSLDTSWIDELINEKLAMINKWETDAAVILTMLIVVGSLGIITGALQASTKNWTKTATIIIGAIISLITLVNNTVFEVDHRVLKKKAHEARKVIREVKFLMKTAKEGGFNTVNNDDRARLYEKIGTLIAKIDGLADDLYSTKTASTSFISLVYAEAGASDTPNWVQEVPRSDGSFRYYVGKGQGRTIRDATEGAAKDLDRKVLEDLKMRWREMINAPFPPDSLYEATPLPVSTENTHFDYDSGKTIYTYYVLIRANLDNFVHELRFRSLANELRGMKVAPSANNK